MSPVFRLADGADALVRSVETEVISRRRRLFESGTPDVISYREAHPEDPLASLIAVIGALDGGHTERFGSMLRSLDGLNIGVLTLGPDNHSSVCISIDADRTVTARTGDSGEPIVGTQLHGLTGVDASDLLAAVLGPTEEPEPDSAVADEAIQHSPAQALPEWPAPELGVLGVPATDDRLRPIEIKILGPYRIFVNGDEITKGLRSTAKELLAWYLLKPQGATAEAAVEALWPETDPSLVSKRFWLALGNLRPSLRDPRGLSDTDVIFKSNDRYLPDADAIACDLWDFQRHLAESSKAEGESELAALRKAVGAYVGDFAEELDYVWAEGIRQETHQRALDAYLRLAELEEAFGHETEAIAVLSRAIEVGGCAEEPSRRLMTLHHRRGRPDAAASTWRDLQRRLAALDLDPERETINLHRELLASLTSPKALE